MDLKPLIEWIKDKRAQTLLTIWAAAAVAACSIPLPDPLVEFFGSMVAVTLRVAVILLVSTVLLAAYIAVSRPRHRYSFDPTTGLQHDLKTGELFCAKCLAAKEPIRAPVRQRKGQPGWICVACHVHYSAIDTEEAAQQLPAAGTQENWVKGYRP